ncbi:MAG: pyruvate:ferredoxin (flavodoxin) oxidoreductase, partial [Clostridia bacterium]
IKEKLDVSLNNKEQEIFNYLDKHITDKKLLNKETVKGSQFCKPKFMFSGACAGCGQPAYIKLLTQLFGDSIMIANATGCSSIYGGSAPSTPYTVPWANSLFEDNAEFGYGMLIANNVMKNRIKTIMESHLKGNEEVFLKWINNMDDYNITKEVYNKIDYSKYKELELVKDYIVARNVW